MADDRRSLSVGEETATSPSSKKRKGSVASILTKSRSQTEMSDKPLKKESSAPSVVSPEKEKRGFSKRFSMIMADRSPKLGLSRKNSKSEDAKAAVSSENGENGTPKVSVSEETTPESATSPREDTSRSSSPATPPVLSALAGKLSPTLDHTMGEDSDWDEKIGDEEDGEEGNEEENEGIEGNEGNAGNEEDDKKEEKAEGEETEKKNETDEGTTSEDKGKEPASEDSESVGSSGSSIVLPADFNLEMLWGVPDCNQTILFCDPCGHPYDIRAATKEKLVEKLTLPLDTGHMHHENYMKRFFMTYRSFCEPVQLVKMLRRRFIGEGIPPDTDPASIDPPLDKVKNAVCRVMVFWINNHYRDFGEDPALLKELQAMINEAKSLPAYPDSLVNYLDKMVQKKLGKGTYTSFFEMTDSVDNCPPPVIPKDWKTATFAELDDLEIARQLTIGEHHIYAEIQPVELQDLAWSKERLKFRAPNLLSMIERFNFFSIRFASLIVAAPKLKQRKKVVEKLVRIAECLMEMNSFNMVMAIMSGFGNAAVYRMKHTFASLPKRTLDVLQQLQDILSTNQSYKSYRELITNAKPPCIPFLGVYLTDLTFVEDGNPDKVQGLVNFRKRQLEYDVIIQVLKFQQVAYNFKLVPKMVSFLNSLPMLNEKEIYETSLLHEPRNAKKKDLK